MCPLIHWHIKWFLSKHFKSCPALVKPLNTLTHASYPHSITAVIPFQHGALHQNPFDCCGERQRLNSSCSNSTQCEPGCYLRVIENNTAVCMHCDSTIADLENFTACNYTYITDRTNRTTVTTVLPTIGGPGVAASLLFGTLLISLFLILSVASFFYLKRSNRLPGIFYRRNKAYIFQPNETAVMIPSATSSVRKPRYVRRERPSANSTSSAATIPTTTTTTVYNV
uniref:Si:ch211-157b11.12 n=1 Tax=Hucho hucho TaxID=62062 RepID=A0A4W5KWZ4_9TELE